MENIKQRGKDPGVKLVGTKWIQGKRCINLEKMGF